MKGWVSEMISDISRIFTSAANGIFGLRSAWRVLGNGFFGDRPNMDRTVVTMDLARALYRNDDVTTNLGAGFARPIIDLTVEFMGLPFASSNNATADNFSNECIHDYWAPQLQEMLRNACRDSRTIVRMVQPKLTNKLVTSAERDHCRLEIVDPERVHIVRDPADKDTILKAFVTHMVDFDESTGPTADPTAGGTPKVKEHTIIETITPDGYTYFDNTDHKWLVSWATGNPWKFVPLVEVFNEYDSTLSGGQSDLEGVYPFLKAFHEVAIQGLQAHKYHSTPKLKFNIKDVTQFLKNNYGDAVIDPASGSVKQDAKINWQGREILFFNSEEDAGFIEAKSVLGDTKTLLEFLIDCISIASETPEWGLMRVEGGTSQGAMNAQTVPFEKKIHRKRVGAQDSIQTLLKMVAAINGRVPERATISWGIIRVDDLVSKGQAVQQIIMGFDVAVRNGWLGKTTVVKILGTMFPEVRSPQEELAEGKQDAKTLLDMIPPAPAPPSGTQALPPPSNGSGSKSSAQRALSTTSASKS